MRARVKEKRRETRRGETEKKREKGKTAVNAPRDSPR